MPNKKRNNRKEFVFNNDEVETKHFSENITIATVNNPEDFKDFYKTPWYVYKDDTNWVAPFWIEYKDFFKKKNPFWKHAETKLFIIYKNQEIVGRIAGIIDNKYCEKVGKKIGYFGFFECVQDYKYAEALFQTAQDWLISKEMKVMRGPIDGRIDVGCGFLQSGFNL